MPKKHAENRNMLEVTREMQRMVADHTTLVLSHYKKIRGIYGWPNKALIDSVRHLWPSGSVKFFEMFDNWFEDQIRLFENNLDEFVDDYAREMIELRIIAPTPGIYRMMVGEHTKLWIENYKNIKKQREDANQMSLESMKKVLPAIIHPVLDNAYKWITQQNEMLEAQILDQMKRIAFNAEPAKK